MTVLIREFLSSSKKILPLHPFLNNKKLVI